jgi:hypothetical protein
LHINYIYDKIISNRAAGFTAMRKTQLNRFSVATVEAACEPSLKAWVNLNRESLKRQFHRRYGLQMKEWPDFTEEQYTKHFNTQALPE